MNRLTRLHRRARRVILARRRLLAALAAATAVAAGLQAAAEPPPPRTMVLTAARDVAAGTVLEPDDLATVAFRPESVPRGVLTSPRRVVGRTTAAPLREGEPITDVRLVSGSILAGYPGAVAAPVRVGDPAAVGLLQVGDRVDVLSADPQGRREAVVVADDAPVLALPERAEGVPGAGQGGFVVLAVPDSTARRLAAAGVSSLLSVVITH